MSRPTRGAMAKAGRPEAPGVAASGRGWAGPGDKTRARAKAPAKAKAGAAKPAREAATQAGKQRLQKVLAAAGVAARRKAEELILAGRVKVNGKVVAELGSKVDPDRDQIYVDGRQVLAAKKVYFVLNKPDGVVCSAEGTKDAEGRPTVLSLFPALPQRIYPVGRLDFHTRGVLILTNDGELAAALTHPRHEVSKTYHVKFQGRLEEADLARLGQPITLEDGTVTRAAEEISVIKDTETNTWIQVTLRQGLNRQIRRMGDAIGRPVLKLIRVAVAGLTADGLADGEFRPMTPTEVYDLMSAANPEPKRPRKAAKAAKPADGSAKPAGAAKPADASEGAKPRKPTDAASAAGSASPDKPRTASDQTRKAGDPPRAAKSGDKPRRPPKASDPRRKSSDPARRAPKPGDPARSTSKPGKFGEKKSGEQKFGDKARSGGKPSEKKFGDKARSGGKPGDARKPAKSGDKARSGGKPSDARKPGKAGDLARRAVKAARPSTASRPGGAKPRPGGHARPLAQRRRPG